MAYTAIPQLLSTIATLPRPYVPGSMFRASRENRALQEQKRSAMADEELRRQRQETLRSQGLEQLGLQRRAQDIGMAENTRGILEAKAAEERQAFRAAQEEWLAAIRQGDMAGAETAKQKLMQTPGVQVERVEPVTPPDPNLYGREDLRNKIAKKKLGGLYSEADKTSLENAPTVELTPTEGPKPKASPGGWKVSRGQDVLADINDEQIGGWQRQAIDETFSKLASENDPELQTAAEKGKQAAMGQLGTRPLPKAIDAGMETYQQEADRIARQRRTETQANRPRGGGGGFNPNTTQDNVNAIYSRIRADFGFEKLNEGESGIRYSMKLLEDRSGLGDASVLKEFVKSTENGGRMSDYDVKFVLERAGKWNQWESIINQWRTGKKSGQLADEYVRQLSSILTKSLEKIDELKIKAGTEFRSEVISNPLLEFKAPGDRENVANRGYKYFSGYDWSPPKGTQKEEPNGAGTATQAEKATAVPKPSKNPGAVESAILKALEGT